MNVELTLLFKFTQYILDEVFLGYQPCQVSILNWCFEIRSDPWWWWPRWSLKHQFSTDTWHNW